MSVTQALETAKQRITALPGKIEQKSRSQDNRWPVIQSPSRISAAREQQQKDRPRAETHQYQNNTQYQFQVSGRLWSRPQQLTKYYSQHVLKDTTFTFNSNLPCFQQFFQVSLLFKPQLQQYGRNNTNCIQILQTSWRISIFPYQQLVASWLWTRS